MAVAVMGAWEEAAELLEAFEGALLEEVVTVPLSCTVMVTVCVTV